MAVAGLLPAAPAHAVAGGAPVTDAAYSFVAKVEADGVSCSGVLVSRQWILTASSCFAVDGKTDPGPPKKATTATVGRTDLSKETGGHVLSVIDLVPRTDRNVVLARLAQPVMDVPPVNLATTAPQTDDVLQVAGFGRTTTEWVPDVLQSAPFVVKTVSATALDVASQAPAEASTCKGDSGGPALRQAAGQLELVALHGTSWQHGCFGSDETRQGGTEIRVDDLGGWIAEKTRDVPGDFNADGKSDIAGINGPRDMLLFTGDGAGKLSYLKPMYPTGGQWKNYRAMTTGDFNGDGKADIAAINSADDMLLFVSDGTGALKYQGPMWPTGGQWKNYLAMTSGDFNGDGKADIAAINSARDLLLFVGDGAGKLTYLTPMYPTGGQWANYKALVGGDFNGDGKSDIAGINSQNDLLLFAGDASTGKLKYLTPMYPTGGQWLNYKALAGGDFNGDGKSDIAGINSHGDLLLFLGDASTGKLKYLAPMWPTGGQWSAYLAIT